MTRKPKTEKSEMKRALQQTQAGIANKARPYKKKAKQAVLDEMLSQVEEDKANTFVQYEDIRNSWKSNFILSPEKLADIAINIYNSSGNKNLDKALDTAFELDDKLAVKANKKVKVLQNLSDEIVSDIFFKGKKVLSIEEVIDFFFGEEVKSKTILGEIVRNQETLFKHLYIANTYIRFAKKHNVVSIDEYREKYIEGLDIPAWATKQINRFKKQGITSEEFYVLLETNVKYFEKYCESEEAFLNKIDVDFMLF